MFGALKKKSLLGLVVSTLLFNVACKSVLNNEANSKTIEQVATEKLGADCNTYPSPAADYKLYVQESPEVPASGILKFVVIETESKTILYEGSYMPGYVKWLDNNSLEVLDYPRMPKDNENPSVYKKVITLKAIK
jgi:hypothetical protein